jgi:hypothetical protein
MNPALLTWGPELWNLQEQPVRLQLKMVDNLIVAVPIREGHISSSGQFRYAMCLRKGSQVRSMR